MRLSDIQSQDLLPRFAAMIAWICQAFDKLIKHITGRTKAIDAPLTIEAIEALTDEELQAYYEQYGLAEYYPDLSRDNRNCMLFQMARMFNLMGTPKAVETLCQYIFDDLDLHIQVKDNLAFDESGNLISSSLYDIFDVTIKPSTNNLPADAINRIFDNVCRFARNSQALRNIIVEEPDNNHNLPVLATNPHGGLMSVSWVSNDDICEDVTPPTPPSYIDILLGIRWDYTVWGAHAFDYPPSVNTWWSGVLSTEDKDTLEAFGLELSRVNTGAAGEIGAIVWDDNYTFEPLAFYADLAGTQENSFDISKFSCVKRTRTSVQGYSVDYVMIWYDGWSNTNNTTWKCRITKNTQGA